MSTKKPEDLKIQVADGIKILEASVTVVKAADNVVEIKIGDSLGQKIDTAVYLTPELIEDMAKKVKDLLGEQSSAVAASGNSPFEGFIAQGIESAPIIKATTSSVISLNKSYLAGQQDKATIIYNIESINIYPKGESRKNQLLISGEKITLAQLFKLIKNLTLPVFWGIVVFLVAIITLSFKAGYTYREITQLIINKQTLSLAQLNSYQISFLKEIYRYQKTTGVNKVIVSRIGFIFDELTNKNTSINVSVNVLGNRANQTSFEDLIMSMPEGFLKRLPATRWGDPYALTVTEETRKLLDK